MSRCNAFACIFAALVLGVFGCSRQSTAGTIVITIERLDTGTRWLLNNEVKELNELQSMLRRWSEDGDRSEVILMPRADVDFETWLKTKAMAEAAGFRDIRTTVSVPIKDGWEEREVVLQRTRGLPETTHSVPTPPAKKQP